MRSPEIDPSWARFETDEQTPLGTWRLELLSEEQLQLDVGEPAVVRIRVTDVNDAPAPDRRVSFALVGQPRDAGLSALDAITDAEGIAENTLVAGMLAATFALRVSTPGAEDRLLEVAVSGEGFGSIRVRAPYEGRRDVTQRIVAAEQGAKCSDARMAFARTVPLSEDSNEAVIDLPAGETFAVIALGESAAQTVVARGCVDGVRVRAKQAVEVKIGFADEPFMSAGQFSVRVELDAAEPARTLSEIVEDAGERLVETDSEGDTISENAEASFMLDSLDQTLRSSAFSSQAELMALADALADARSASSGTPPERSLQQILDGYSTGPLVAIPRVASVTRTSLEELVLFAALTLDGPDSKHPVVWQSRRIQARPTIQGGNPPSVDLARLRLAANTEAEFLGDDDELELSSVTFRANLGALAAEVLPRALTAIAEGDSTHPDPFGCNTLGLWLRERDELGGDDCGSDCLRAVCDHVIERIAAAANTALSELDDERPDVRLRGAFTLNDKNGDLLADNLQAETFDGEWLAVEDDDVDAISGAASATALTETSQLP